MDEQRIDPRRLALGFLIWVTMMCAAPFAQSPVAEPIKNEPELVQTPEKPEPKSDEFRLVLDEAGTKLLR